MDNLSALTGQNISTFLLVLVALAGLFILFANVVEAARKLRKPHAKESQDLADKQNACDRKFAHDQQVLNEHKDRIEELEKGARVQCAALHALLEHALHNGNSAEMKRASDDLFAYLNR